MRKTRAMILLIEGPFLFHLFFSSSILYLTLFFLSLHSFSHSIFSLSPLSIRPILLPQSRINRNRYLGRRDQYIKFIFHAESSLRYVDKLAIKTTQSTEIVSESSSKVSGRSCTSLKKDHVALFKVFCLCIFSVFCRLGKTQKTQKTDVPFC